MSDVQQQRLKRWGVWFSNQMQAEQWTQVDAADALQFSKTQVQRWQAGQVLPREASLMQIWQGFKHRGVTLTEVYDAAGYPYPDADLPQESWNRYLDDEEWVEIMRRDLALLPPQSRDMYKRRVMGYAAIERALNNATDLHVEEIHGTQEKGRSGYGTENAGG